MNAQKQTVMIMDYIDDFGSITPVEAMIDLGVMRLAARIADLRRSGVQIVSERVNGVNRYGKPVHYARYRRSD